MGPKKLTLKAAIEALRDSGKRDAARIRGQNSAGRATRVHLAPDLPLNVEVFRDGLNYPLAGTNVFQVIFEIAGLNEARVLRDKERGWFLLQRVL